MPHAEHQVTINRPAADVFAYLADGENCPQWRDGVIEITKTSGDGLSAQYKQSVRGPDRRSIPADYTITEYTPKTALAFQTTSGPVRSGPRAATPRPSPVEPPPSPSPSTRNSAASRNSS